VVKKVEFAKVDSTECDEGDVLVVSEIVDGGDVVALFVNHYIDTDRYTGPTKGVRIPLDKVEWLIEQLGFLKQKHSI